MKYKWVMSKSQSQKLFLENKIKAKFELIGKIMRKKNHLLINFHSLMVTFIPDHYKYQERLK